MKPHPTKKRQSEGDRKPSGERSAKGEILGSASRDPVVARHIDPKWFGYYRVLLALRRRLSDDREEELAEVAESLEPHSMSQADSATDEFDHDMLLAELSMNQDKLFEVDEALRRIENKTYGVCELTGKPISKERLKAVPWTRFTKEAEEQLEEQQAVGRAHLGDVHSLRPVGRAAPGSAETELDQAEPSVRDLPRIEKQIIEKLAADEELKPPPGTGEKSKP